MNNKVFVYDLLKKEFAQYNVLKAGIYIGEAITKEKYSYYNDVFCPLVIENEKSVKIKGDLYEIDDEILTPLDYLDDHPDGYYMKEIPVISNEKEITAWFYFFKPPTDEHIENSKYNNCEHINDILSQTYNKFFSSKEKLEISYLKTGINELDEIIDLVKSDLVIIASDTGAGKTSMGLNIATNIAVNGKFPVIIFTLNMSKEHVVKMILSSLSGVSMYKIIEPDISKDDTDKLIKVSKQLSEATIYINDTCYSIDSIKSEVKRIFIKYQRIGAVIIDPMDLVDGFYSENRLIALFMITEELKKLANKLGFTVIVLSQLNYYSVTTQNKLIINKPNRPVLGEGELRINGSNENNADIIMLIYRNENNFNPQNEEIAEIIIAKNKNGSVGTINLKFEASKAKFSSLDL